MGAQIRLSDGIEHVGVTMPLHRLERVARRRTLIAIVDDQRAAALTGDSSGKIRCNGDAGGCGFDDRAKRATAKRSEEHTSELQSLMRISYAVFCLKKKHNII